MRPATLFLISFLLLSNLAASPAAPANEPHPGIPDHPVWVRPTLAVIAILFAAAIPIGLMVRYNMKAEEEPVETHAAHAHEPHAHH